MIKGWAGLGWAGGRKKGWGEEGTDFKALLRRQRHAPPHRHTEEKDSHTQARSQRLGSLSAAAGGCPGLVPRSRGFCSPSGSTPRPPHVLPIGLETNMAAFVYFLIGMPASWIMSATAAASGHSLHKQQLEKRDLGHCLGDFPSGPRKQKTPTTQGGVGGEELSATQKSDTQTLPGREGGPYSQVRFYQ